MTWASSHDSLTGLANRAAFEVLLEHASARAAELPFCALCIDLDRFKQVNDSGGHAPDDALPRDVAQVLAAQGVLLERLPVMHSEPRHCPFSQRQRIPPSAWNAFIAPAPMEAPKRLASRSATFSFGV